MRALVMMGPLAVVGNAPVALRYFVSRKREGETDRSLFGQELFLEVDKTTGLPEESRGCGL